MKKLIVVLEAVVLMFGVGDLLAGGHGHGGHGGALVGEHDSSLSGAAEVGGEPNRLICSLIHRGGAA